MTRKHINKKCTINIEKSIVTLVIETNREDKQVIIVPNNNDPRAIYPLPDMKLLMDNAKYFSKHGVGGGTVKGFLKSYIQGRNDDINEQIIEIRKSLKRIEKALKCIDVVEEELKRS